MRGRLRWGGPTLQTARLTGLLGEELLPVRRVRRRGTVPLGGGAGLLEGGAGLLGGTVLLGGGAGLPHSRTVLLGRGAVPFEGGAGACLAAEPFCSRAGSFWSDLVGRVS